MLGLGETRAGIMGLWGILGWGRQGQTLQSAPVWWRQTQAIWCTRAREDRGMYHGALWVGETNTEVRLYGVHGRADGDKDLVSWGTQAGGDKGR